MAITVTTSTPADGATDYFINKSVSITFNKAISSSSLTPNVFSLIDIDSNTAVPLTVSASTESDTKILLLPSLNLKSNTQYRIIVVGTDQGLGYSLVASDTETLTTTITIEFATGSTVYKIDTTVEKEVSNLTLEGDLFLPTNLKAIGLEFTILKTRPKNFSHAIAPTVTGDSTIRFTFSKALNTGADYSTWADVSLFPLLNDTAYLSQNGDFGTGVIPNYTITGSGTELIVTFDGALPKNLGVQINLTDSITSLEGDEYGGNLQYSVNTQLYPEIYGIQTVKREIREIADVYSEDYIGALLFKNSIWLWEKLGRSFSLDTVPYAAKQYVLCSTILDLMEDREYYKYVLAGTRRQLGDLGVSVDNLIGRLAMKVAKYQKAKEIALESLNRGWQFRVGSSMLAYDNIAADINRLWYDVSDRYTDTRLSYLQLDQPASNTTDNRRARSNNPI